MQFKIHNEGWVYLVSTIILTIIIIPFFYYLGILFFFLSLFIFYFFRDPNRSIPIEDFIISPADGTITFIGDTNIPKEISGSLKTYTKISIFLSILDVHVNRMPIDGKISNINYISGKFINATLNKSSNKNERNIIEIKNNNHSIYLVQIAGLIARRIVCNLKENQEVKKGDRIGIIKFGSRVDLYLPKNYNILVSNGQKVIGGETIISNPKNISSVSDSIIK